MLLSSTVPTVPDARFRGIGAMRRAGARDVPQHPERRGAGTVSVTAIRR